MPPCPIQKRLIKLARNTIGSITARRDGVDDRKWRPDRAPKVPMSPPVIRRAPTRDCRRDQPWQACVAAVSAMDRVCRWTERSRCHHVRASMPPCQCASTSHRHGYDVYANHLDVKAMRPYRIWVYCVVMSRIIRGAIYALTSQVETRRKVSHLRGVYPVHSKSNVDHRLSTRGDR